MCLLVDVGCGYSLGDCSAVRISCMWSAKGYKWHFCLFGVDKSSEDLLLVG